MKLQKSFEGKINLGTLTEHIIHFFESRKFEEVTALQVGDGYQVIASDSQMYRIRSDLKVDVRKEGESFSVSFELSKKAKRIDFPMTLAAMFGGGYFILRDLKSDEAWRKTEREFWSEINNMITENRERTGSAPTNDKKARTKLATCWQENRASDQPAAQHGMYRRALPDY